MFDSTIFFPFISGPAGNFAIVLLGMPLFFALFISTVVGLVRRQMMARENSRNGMSRKWIFVDSGLVVAAILFYVFALLPSDFARRGTAREVADVFSFAHRNKSVLSFGQEGVESVFIESKDKQGNVLRASVKTADLARIAQAIQQGIIPKGDIDWSNKIPQ